MNFTRQYLQETADIASRVDEAAVEAVVQLIHDTRQAEGRLFFLGVGGSAGNASHAVNDFRKIVGIETYTPTDNVSELTARTNDEGWPEVFRPWLVTSHLSARDMLFILSVGGGNLERAVSVNLIRAMELARDRGAKVAAIVGRADGYAATHSDACIVVPNASPERVTPHSEGFQSILLHLIVSHPQLKQQQTKWESLCPKP